MVVFYFWVDMPFLFAVDPFNLVEKYVLEKFAIKNGAIQFTDRRFQNRNLSLKYISYFWSTFALQSKSLLKNILLKTITVQRTDRSAHALHARTLILIIMFAPCRFRRVLPTIHDRSNSLRRQRPTSLCSHPFIHGACYRRLATNAFITWPTPSFYEI